MKPMTKTIAHLVFFVGITFGWSYSLAQDTFPVVEQSTQKIRDNKRLEILQTELATEKKSLETAKLAYLDAITNKLPDNKILALKEQVLNHTKNIEALNNEVANLGKTAITANTSSPVRITKTTNNTSKKDQAAPYWDTYRRQQESQDE